MLLSISTASLYYKSARRALVLAAEAGFSGVELVLGPRLTVGQCERVADGARQLGLAVCSVHESLAAGRLAPCAPANLLVDAVQAAIRAGASVAVVHPPGTTSWSHPDALDWLAALHKARDTAARHDVQIAVENPGHYVASDRGRVLAVLADLVAFCRRYGFAMTLDTCHVGTTGEALGDAWDRAESLVRNVHVSDLRRPRSMVGNGLLRKLAHEHRFPGEGDLDLSAFVRYVGERGYEGPLTMEVSPIALMSCHPRLWRERLASLARWARVSIGQQDKNSVSYP